MRHVLDITSTEKEEVGNPGTICPTKAHLHRRDMLEDLRQVASSVTQFVTRTISLLSIQVVPRFVGSLRHFFVAKAGRFIIPSLSSDLSNLLVFNHVDFFLVVFFCVCVVLRHALYDS